MMRTLKKLLFYGGAALAFTYGCLTAAPAWADEPKPDSPLVVTIDYSLDTVGIVKGGAVRRAQTLDHLSLGLDIDLDRALGLGGFSAHIEGSNTSGGAPGERAGALQGVDNIEVSARRLRLYQAWLEAGLAQDRVNLRVGFSDLSGEFATSDASGFLLNPSFGFAPEFAASGAAAFPSTALGARLRVAPTEATYVQVAVVNARAGVPGDDGGADFSFNDGEILVAEAGWTGNGRVTLGYWRLSKKQDDLLTIDSSGAPVSRIAEGAYAAAEQTLLKTEDGARTAVGFARAGLSDGRTTPFRASFQAGVLLQPAVSSRPESTLTAGVTHAWLSTAYRGAEAAAGNPLARSETVFELTYSDQLTRNIRIQPDLQYVRNPSAAPGARDAIVAGLRINIGF
ncbi:carbohydrate porin [Phenylobacterium sp.]|jgi:porin|uniref:carbohydrate porin n=1 Tax=Phenylobacterium sp. TaxID=1871053 RepID=UPI0037C65872